MSFAARRAAVGFLAATLTAAALVAVPIVTVRRAAAGTTKPPAEFADGTWALSYLADVQIAGPFPGGTTGTGQGVVTGTGIFEVKGGGVSGTHTGAGTATSAITVASGQSGPATLNLALNGPVAGTATRAVLQGDVRASGSVSVSTPDLTMAVPVAFGGALGDGNGAPLSTFSVQCDRITGTWTVDLRGSGRPATGASVAGPATFVAIRSDGLSGATPEYATQVSQLLSDADGFVGRVGNGPLDTAGLDAIAVRSEVLDASVPAVQECDGQRDARGYGTLIGVEVSRLLSAARGQVASLSTADLAYLLGLGYRTGAIGSGSTWSGATATERALHTELDRRFTAATLAHDVATATLVSVARHQYGALRPTTKPKRSRQVRGVAVIRPTDPTRGRGLRPVLSWPPVAGAASYRVVILDGGRRPYWAWQGDATSVRVGGAPSACRV